MEKPGIGDVVKIHYRKLESLSKNKQIPEPPADKRTRKHHEYSFLVQNVNTFNDEETISANLIFPEFPDDYLITTSYKYFSKDNTTSSISARLIKRYSQTQPASVAENSSENPREQRQVNGTLDKTQNSPAQIEESKHNGIKKQEQLENSSQGSGLRITDSFSIPHPENDPSIAKLDLPENVSGYVRRSAITLTESKVKFYECLLKNAKNQLERMKEKDAKEDPEDRLGMIKDIQLKELQEEYFKKMSDIFNDEPVEPYVFRNLWEDRYPVLDFTMEQRLPLLIMFEKNTEHQQAYREYMRGTSIFKLSDQRQVYGSLNIPMWEADKPDIEKPTTLNGAKSVIRFALPFRNTAVLMYACRGSSCRFYRPTREAVEEHETKTKHFTEPEKRRSKKTKNELMAHANQQQIKRENQYSSDESVVEVEVTQSKEIIVKKNRRRSRKNKETESKVFTKKLKMEDEHNLSSDESVLEVEVPRLKNGTRGRDSGESSKKKSASEIVPVNKKEMKCEDLSDAESIIEVGIGLSNGITTNTVDLGNCAINST
ncbi:uncharacterized protein LOC135847286 isoform X2 [Planococcus citri]|uniref:uncharacterized protein LOC135847286 isoform X2 n=1 Tax=Planococcus citri TaxID=170843 RepID=UPI0031F8566D